MKNKGLIKVKGDKDKLARIKTKQQGNKKGESQNGKSGGKK